MTPVTNLLAQALEYHRNLPERIRDYLRHARGIADEVIDLHFLGWNGQRISIPIADRYGQVVAFKFAKDPADTTNSPKMLATPGARAELYGWERVLAKPTQIIICEGEFDRLVLESQGLCRRDLYRWRSHLSPGVGAMLRPDPLYICMLRQR